MRGVRVGDGGGQRGPEGPARRGPGRAVPRRLRGDRGGRQGDLQREEEAAEDGGCLTCRVLNNHR